MYLTRPNFNPNRKHTSRYDDDGIHTNRDGVIRDDEKKPRIGLRSNVDESVRAIISLVAYRLVSAEFYRCALNIRYRRTSDFAFQFVGPRADTNSNFTTFLLDGFQKNISQNFRSRAAVCFICYTRR